MHQLHAAIAICAEPERVRALLDEGWHPHLPWLLQVLGWDVKVQPLDAVTAMPDPRSARWEIAGPLDAPHGSRLEVNVKVRAPFRLVELFAEPFATDWLMADLWHLKQAAEHPPVK